MLRIILWGLIFEWFNFIKAVGFKGPDAYYLAYGANRDPDVMQRRAMAVKSSLPATEDGFALKFNREVPFDGIGMAPLERRAGAPRMHLVFYWPTAGRSSAVCWLLAKNHQQVPIGFRSERGSRGPIETPKFFTRNEGEAPSAVSGHELRTVRQRFTTVVREVRFALREGVCVFDFPALNF